MASVDSLAVNEGVMRGDGMSMSAIREHEVGSDVAGCDDEFLVGWLTFEEAVHS